MSDLAWFLVGAVVKSIIAIVALLGAFAYMTLIERRIIARFQRRVGIDHAGGGVRARRRVAAGLLKAGTDFGLLRGSVAREFAGFHIPERSFVYVLHALRTAGTAPAKLTSTPSPRARGLAGAEHASRRLAGPSAAGASAEWAAPVSTTGTSPR